MSEIEVAQWFSIAASVFTVFGYFSTSDVRAKKIIMIGVVLFAIHFYLMGAITAMLMMIVNFFRVDLSIKFHKSIKLFSVFIVIYLIAGALSYDSWISILPVIAAMSGCVGMYLLAGIKFRLASIIGSLCWLTHNILIFSIGGITTEIFVFTAHIVTIFRLRKEAKQNA